MLINYAQNKNNSGNSNNNETTTTKLMLWNVVAERDSIHK